MGRGAGWLPKPALSAQVSLFSEPPQPSRSLAVGTVATGSRVLTLGIPQARTAALGMATAPATASAAAPASPGAGVLIHIRFWGVLPHSPFPTLGHRCHLSSCFLTAAAPGPSERGDSPQPRSPPVPGGRCPTCPEPCCCPGPRLTRALAGQIRRLQAQVRTGRLLGPEEMQKGECGGAVRRGASGSCMEKGFWGECWWGLWGSGLWGLQRRGFGGSSGGELLG